MVFRLFVLLVYACLEKCLGKKTSHFLWKFIWSWPENADFVGGNRCLYRGKNVEKSGRGVVVARKHQLSWSASCGVVEAEDVVGKRILRSAAFCGRLIQSLSLHRGTIAARAPWRRTLHRKCPFLLWGCDNTNNNCCRHAKMLATSRPEHKHCINITSLYCNHCVSIAILTTWDQLVRSVL